MPLISIVIPTRNRLPYLKETLQSALDLPQQEIEVIVADNATDDGTKEYLESFGSRIKVTRTDHALSMTDNWYRGLDLITGEWVMFVGDDDYIMPNFLSVIRDIMRQLPDIELITWKCANYRWPDCPIDQNMLRFNFGSKAEVRNSGEELKAVFEELRNILAPPSLYHSLTKRSVIARIKENYGEYRLGIVPDLGSGLLNLAFTKQYVSCPLPLTIMGFSKKSTGTSFKGGGLFSAPAQEFRRLSKLAELEQKYLPEIEDYHQNVGQWRLLLEWQDYFASKGLQLSFNNPLMLKYCIDHLYGLPMDSREKSAATLLAYAEKQGADMPSYTARAKFAMAQTSLTVPGFRKVSEDHVSVSVNLSATPIKSTSAVAGLIRGFYTS